MQKIEIGKNVSEIGEKCFYLCEKLKTIIALGATPPNCASSTFDYDASNTSYFYTNATLFVPKNHLNAYKNADKWKKFKSIIGIDIFVGDIQLNTSALSLPPGETFQLSATVLPENATNKQVVWESDDDHIVMVSETGMLTAIEEGVATIFCTAADGSGVQTECVVTVKEHINTAGDGTLEHPFNAVEAIQKASELAVGAKSTKDYFVSGKISQVKYYYTAQRGTATFYLSDDGTTTNQFYVYGSYYLDN